MKVLLDTNVLIAAFITKGACSELFDHCIRQHQIISSGFILEELEVHLRKKFKFSEEDVRETLDILSSVAILIQPVALKMAICRDPDDDIVLATALTGGADCIVSGDKDLTDLKIFENIPILKPAEFSEFEANK